MQNKLQRVIRFSRKNSGSASALDPKFSKVNLTNSNESNWRVGMTHRFSITFPHAPQIHKSYKFSIKHPKHAYSHKFNCTQLMHTKYTLANLKNVHYFVFLEGSYSHQIQLKFNLSIFLHKLKHKNNRNQGFGMGMVFLYIITMSTFSIRMERELGLPHPPCDLRCAAADLH